MTFAHLNRKSSLYFFFLAGNTEGIRGNWKFGIFLIFNAHCFSHNSNIFGNELKSLHYGSSPL